MLVSFNDHTLQFDIFYETRHRNTVCYTPPFYTQVITMPRSNMGELYYCQKLNLFNLTVFELGLNDGYCYTWHEAECQKSPQEVAAGVVRWLTRVDSRGPVTEVMLFSDSTVSQNRCRCRLFSSAMIQFLLTSENISKITHKV